MLARVVAVADSFDAMTSTRSYSRARPVPVALAELERCAGSQFDPAMVKALVGAIGRHGWHPVVTSDDDLQVIGPAAAPGPAGSTAPAPRPEVRAGSGDGAPGPREALPGAAGAAGSGDGTGPRGVR